MRRFSSSGGVPTLNDSRPSPISPTRRCVSGEPVAPHSGGCGFCRGLGSTRRCGIDQCLPSNSYSSLVQQPTMWLERFLPHLAGVVRVDAEAFELGARRRAPGAELDAPVGDQVEHRRGLGGANGVVVRLGQQAHAVAEAHVLRLQRDGAVEHLGVRAVRVLLEEVVLDRPERVEAHLVAEDRLLDRVLVRADTRCRSFHGRATGIS